LHVAEFRQLTQEECNKAREEEQYTDCRESDIVEAMIENILIFEVDCHTSTPQSHMRISVAQANSKQTRTYCRKVH
jgi:hypothetical protein